MTSNYKNNIPQSDDRLIDSQLDLLNNAAQADTTLGVDHYDFSDNTTNNGKHKTVTHIDQTSHPSTATTEVKSYAVDTGTLGLMTWSRSADSAGTGGGIRGISAVHSDGQEVIPVSPSRLNVIDFASLNACAGTLMAWSDTTDNKYSFARFFWAPTVATTSLQLQVVGEDQDGINWVTDSVSVLQLAGGGTAINAYWTVTIDRYVV